MSRLLKGKIRLMFVGAALIMPCIFIAVFLIVSDVFYHNQPESWQAGKKRGSAKEAIKQPDAEPKNNLLEQVLLRVVFEQLKQERNPAEQEFLGKSAEAPQGLQAIDEISDDNSFKSADDKSSVDYLNDSEAEITLASNAYEHTDSVLFHTIESIEMADPEQVPELIEKLLNVAVDTNHHEMAIKALEDVAIQSYDSDIIAFAESAITELKRTINRQETLVIVTNPEFTNDTEKKKKESLYEASSSVEQERTQVLEAATSQAVDVAHYNKISHLRTIALDEYDEENRKQAIQDLSNFRSEASVDALILAADDPSPTNRYLALQGLWFSAIDGWENDRGDIWLCFRKATSDENSIVVDLAKKVITDLDRLQNDSPADNHELPFQAQSMFEYTDEEDYLKN